jgi:hypothetical protein
LLTIKPNSFKRVAAGRESRLRFDERAASAIRKRGLYPQIGLAQAFNTAAHQGQPQCRPAARCFAARPRIPMERAIRNSQRPLTVSTVSAQ